MRGFQIAATLCVMSATLAACACPHGESSGSGRHQDSVHMSTCACREGMAGGTAWCDKCQMGFVNGEKVACKGCYVEKTGGAPCPMCSGKR